MKKLTIFTAIMVTCMVIAVPVSAQEDKGFKKYDVKENFTENGFQSMQRSSILQS